MSALDAVLGEFQRDVARVEHLLELVKTYKDFGASAPAPRSPTDADPWPEATALLEASRRRHADLPVLSGSLQLYLAGRFEYCMRQVVEVVADEVATQATGFGDLPEPMKKSLRQKTLEIAQNPGRHGYDEEEADALLSGFVASTQSTSAPVSIKSSVISVTDANMKDRVLAEILGRVGMKDFWSDVGKQSQMKLALDKSGDREATAESIARLGAIMDERNGVAHPTANTHFPDADQVMKAAHFLRTLASTTVDLAKVYLASQRQADV